jgi:hypothetical protein
METMGAIAAAGFSHVSLIAELPMQGNSKPKKVMAGQLNSATTNLPPALPLTKAR